LLIQPAESASEVQVFRFGLMTRVGFSDLLIERFACEPDPALLFE
jgi:hypothetical protein